MTNSKFELLDESRELVGGNHAYRIRALKDFNDVKAGELGGFFESEENLSFEENDASWVYDDSIVSNGAVIKDDSIVSGNSMVRQSYIDKESKITNKSHVAGGEIENTAIDSSLSHYTNSRGTSIKNSDVYNSNIHDSEIESSYLYDGSIFDSKMSNGASIIDGGLTGGSATTETHPHIDEDGIYPTERFESPIQLTDDDLTDLNDLDKGLER